MIRRFPILPTIIVGMAVATMMALGFWQLGRAEWKADLLDRYRAADGIETAVEFPTTQAEIEAARYRRSSVDCVAVLAMRSGAGTSAQGTRGWMHVAHCALDGGRTGDVALGFSRDPQTPEWSGGEARGIISSSGTLVANPPLAGLGQLAKPDPNDLPNNHLAYAGQWFFFAVTALAIYFLAVRRRLRPSGRE
ncbi:SURF1 family cytochrome oxidase biogenesis protein [Pseudopontixanthobacter vadosimaris]|uniref:SURF1 family cytochrome oxidase biogenesis protein n=1 Tax=Pseudopontixanthobacter vadosimaris TaxID=2726450 RepID=UPI001472DD80|nr:SURF1 family cytochrome oxidase biogenesis protein [Pseudopontixanthobacter vadosimaris]